MDLNSGLSSGRTDLCRRNPLKIFDNLREPKCGGDYITQKIARSTAINFSSGGNLVSVPAQEGFDEVNCREFVQIFGFFPEPHISNWHLQGPTNS